MTIRNSSIHLSEHTNHEFYVRPPQLENRKAVASSLNHSLQKNKNQRKFVSILLYMTVLAIGFFLLVDGRYPLNASDEEKQWNDRNADVNGTETKQDNDAADDG